MIRILLALGVLLAASPACSATEIQASFDRWLADFRAEAMREGISRETLQAGLTSIQPIQKVIDLDRKQPEKKKTFAEYRRNVVNQNRIREGREYVQAYARELATVEKRYGVAPQYIVALWGIETNFGGNTGGFKVIPALATLAWEGRRAKFFREELLAALKIVDEGHISVAAMKGSWAGAMGQNQFMPTSFRRFAVDNNNDGRIDIWDTESDIFASSANYLSKSGWVRGQRWGREVKLPSGFPENLIGMDKRQPMRFWVQKGVLTADKKPLPHEENIQASIVAPDGLGGPAYIVYNNYRAVMAWNKSTYFATSVGLLADAIAR